MCYSLQSHSYEHKNVKTDKSFVREIWLRVLWHIVLAFHKISDKKHISYKALYSSRLRKTVNIQILIKRAHDGTIHNICTENSQNSTFSLQKSIIFYRKLILILVESLLALEHMYLFLCFP
jgi:hypothetical protein